MTTQTAPTTAQMTMLRRWSVVCALFGKTLEEGFSAMRFVTSVHAQGIHIGCGCGCGGDGIQDFIEENPQFWQLGEAMDNCRTRRTQR
jgi:hypothetical protein